MNIFETLKGLSKKDNDIEDEYVDIEPDDVDFDETND